MFGKTPIINTQKAIQELQTNTFNPILNCEQEDLFLNFIKKLIVKNVEQRLNAEQALDDIFLKKS